VICLSSDCIEDLSDFAKTTASARVSEVKAASSFALPMPIIVAALVDEFVSGNPPGFFVRDTPQR
jgi:hypothetical protein